MTEIYIWIYTELQPDAVFINAQRENENETLDMQTFSMINITSVTEILKKSYRSEFSKEFERYFVSVLLIQPLCCQNK